MAYILANNTATLPGLNKKESELQKEPALLVKGFFAMLKV